MREREEPYSLVRKFPIKSYSIGVIVSTDVFGEENFFNEEGVFHEELAKE
jgi:hypothetical protein